MKNCLISSAESGGKSLEIIVSVEADEVSSDGNETAAVAELGVFAI